MMEASALRARLAVPLFMVLSGSLVLSGTAFASPPSAEGSKTSSPTGPASSPTADTATSDPIRVDVAPEIADAEFYPDWIKQRHPTIASRFPANSEEAQWISVELDGATYAYSLTVSAVRGGTAVGSVAGNTISCDCSRDELLVLVDEEIERAVEQLHATVEVPEVDEEEEAPPPPVVVEDKPPPLGLLGYAGIGVAVLGIGVLGGGISLAVRPDDVRGDPGAVERRTTRPLGIAMCIGGGLALAAGTALTVFDVVKRRKDRLAFRPIMSPRSAGMMIRMKF